MQMHYDPAAAMNSRGCVVAAAGAGGTLKTRVIPAGLPQNGTRKTASTSACAMAAGSSYDGHGGAGASEYLQAH